MGIDGAADHEMQFPTELLPLHGSRIVLRAMRDDDAADLFDLYGDPEVMRYTDEDPFPDLVTVGLMLDSVRRLLACGQSLEWAIALRKTGRLAGTCGLHSLDRRSGKAEMGCLLLRAAWGKGYMAEAAALVMDHATQRLSLRHLDADVAADNRRAQRFFQKLGFSQVGSERWRIDLPRCDPPPSGG